MKGIILVLTILLVNIKVKAADSFCWSELLDDPFPCCTKDDGPIEGENMEGSWGIENGQKCGYRSRYANWNLRDKFDDTREEWEAFKLKWDNKYRDNFERIAITPGKKESLLNFGWESTTEFEPSIRLSTSRDMENAKIFDGENEFYRKKMIKLNNKWEDPVKFNTFDPDNFKFIFLGDPQIGGSIGRHQYHSSDYFDYAEAIRNDAFNWNITIFNSIKFTKTPSLILSAGDQADTMGDDITQEQQYSGLLLPELIKTIPFAPTLGNHEVFSESFRRHFNVPHPYIPKKYDDLDYVPAYNYYFKYNNVLVVVLESNHNSCHDCEIVMAKAVDKYPNTDWRIALFHHDIYGNGATHSQGDAKKLRPCLTGLFDIYKFDLVINGHDHVYTTTKFINYNNSNKKSYTLSEIKEGVTNKNPKGTFFITANCSSGSKFLDFTDKTLDYVFNSTQTFTSTFGVLDFKKESGKVKMIINIHEVETFKTIDGPFIFEKDAKEETEDDNKCWSNFLGYPCCKKTDDIIYNAVKGSWGYENNSWCGLDFTDAETCWAYPLGYACCRKTKIIQRIDKNGKKYGFESGGVCAFTDEDTDLEILTEDCKGLSEGYPCCSSLSMKTSGYDDQWGYEDNDWCRLTDEQELEYKENLKKCWAYARNYKCCSNPNTKCWAEELDDGYPCCKTTNVVIETDGNGEWGIENDQWCGIRKCWSLKLDEPYPCCVYATEIIYTNENGKWSMENGDCNDNNNNNIT
ncbi:Metallo-dependent phosphatase [Neocallimastix californiae]|uniref:Metallo-dependent phosphatase n=1 Tax=Neocallimastix californiae TaxID=1754190 RepID=A0A1Y2DZ12_9FUNG|nr:Metallo-dependent phosphatase [Neocallimastix californiae]|eukprot:ORY64532.1 Metallo-dependent phosphatase [Neocallimastix californiae]